MIRCTEMESSDELTSRMSYSRVTCNLWISCLVMGTQLGSLSCLYKDNLNA